MTTESIGDEGITSEKGDVEEKDDIERPLEVESLCMNCYKNGTTKLMSTKIPFYKQVIVASFYCDHCGYRNNELQSAEPVQEFGTEIVLHVKEPSDLNRTVVKSDVASIEIPEVELTILPKSQPGEVTNVEGVLARVSNGLQQDQQRRAEADPALAEKIDLFLARLQDLRELKTPWTLKLKDATGNCFVENPNPLHVDPRCITSHYCRTLDENKLLGLVADDAEETLTEQDATDREWKSYEDVKNEVIHFKGSCPQCGAPTETMMKPTDIPYFQTVIIMSTKCDFCGYKSNDVKSGGVTQDLGCRLTVKIEEDVDLTRDVLKSDTCELQLPGLDIEVGPGALSGRFTTVEGILQALRDQLNAQSAFFTGDSAIAEAKQKWERKLAEIDDVLSLRRKGEKLVLNDPAGNSYIQSLSAPLDDSRLVKEYYTRSYEQNDELGLNDMKVENYQEMDPIQEDPSEE